MARRALRLTGLLAMVGMLAACGGAAPTPTAAPETTPEATLPVPAEIDPGAVAFEVTGDVTLSANPARAGYHYLDGVERQQLLIQDADGAYMLLFILPQNPQPGTHPLEASGREYAEDGVYVAAFTEALVDEAAMFSVGIDGTITLDAVGDHISGSFEFRAQNANGQRVAISGTFEDVPLIYG